MAASIAALLSPASNGSLGALLRTDRAVQKHHRAHKLPPAKFTEGAPRAARAQSATEDEMAELATDVHIFLSSTFLDFKELREEIAIRLRDVFGAHLLVMETSGSDDAPPVVSSVRRVRESDVFVGIYARRYGSVDAATGKSITELELYEAERSLSAGTLTAILLYLLDETASWPISLCETDPEAVANLASLRDHSRQHTYTPFHDPTDLPFFIIRDVLAKIRYRMTEPSFRTRQQVLPARRRLQRPIGMEFLTSADRQHLCGRGEKTKELLGTVEANEITLLLGNSGVGKTSLIHAGLLPAAVAAGWFSVYTRPLGLPRTDVVSGLLATVFEGPHSYRGALLSPLENAAAAVAPRRLLLIIDQFEDILTARDEAEAERLVEDLRSIRYMDNPSFRVLVSYRADLESRLGRFWQTISGSPAGLPRVYVTGIGGDEAWISVESSCGDLRVELALSDSDKAQIKRDLQTFSARQGDNSIYPPYVQMLIDHIWKHLERKPGVYRLGDYLVAKGMEGITAGYLARQLEYAHDPHGHLKSVLVSLVRSYGVKAQKSLAEVAADVRIAEKDCEVALETLIDLRLVRHIADLYEIAHDFLAQEISARLVDSEEREFKRIRELLASKSATFSTTSSVLTVEELLMLFKHKERLLPSDDELRLILASWAEGKGPGLYLLLGEPPSRLVELIRSEEGKEDTDREGRAMLALLRRKASGAALQKEDWMLFRRYRLGIELAAIINASPLECPDPVLLWALRNKRRALREAGFKAITLKVADGQWNWIEALSKSVSASCRSSYEQLVLDAPLLPLESLVNASRSYREFSLLQRIARARTGQELRESLMALKKFRPRARTWLFGKGIVRHRHSGVKATLNSLHKHEESKVVTLLNSICPNLSDRDFLTLLDCYLFWNLKEAGLKDDTNGHLWRIYEGKATALAETILKVSSQQNLGPLRRVLRKVSLTPSAQYLAKALIRLGSSSDIVALIKKVEQADYQINYWFQIEMGQIVGRRMTELGEPIPTELLQILQRDDFWKDPRALNLKSAHKSSRPLKNLYNRALYIRMVAHALIGASRDGNLDLLKDLSMHEFRMIARAAAIRLAQLDEDRGIRMLQSVVTGAIEHQHAEAFGLAVRDAEIESLGLVELW